MKDITFINVSGFFFSGSSAMVDLLKEFDAFYESNAEIRFIKDPYGIVQLEDALIKNWELINSSAAISDFLEMCNKGCRNGKGLFSPAGFNLKKTISKDFMKITHNYINELTDYYYKQDYYHYKFKKSYIKFVIDRYRWAIEYLSKGRLRTANRNIAQCYFSHPDQERFNRATQNYFYQLFEQHAKDKGRTYIILDQAVSPNNTQVIHRYFSDSKMIIIDRDPRDMYCDEILWGEKFDSNYRTKEAAMNYVKRQKALRDNIVLDSDIIKVRFEDLILDYENTVSQVLNFLNLDKTVHSCPKKFLKPEKSARNIGIWKNYLDDCGEAIEVIAEELPDLLYHKNS